MKIKDDEVMIGDMDGVSWHFNNKLKPLIEKIIKELKEEEVIKDV